MIIKNFKRIGNTSSKKKALQIIEAGLKAIKTEKVIREKVSLEKNRLIISDFNNKKTEINLNNHKKIVVIGFGKASSLMGKEIENILKEKIDSGLIISTKKINLKKIQVIKGTHPHPTQTNIDATKKMVNLIKNLSKEDLVICLISGGGSALLCDPKMQLAEYHKTIKKHFSSGIDIVALNKIRKSLSNVKDGKLAKLTKASIVSLILSDVVGDDLSTISSGPTHHKDAKNARNIIILNNQVALDAMSKKATDLGLTPIIITNRLNGEARTKGKSMLKILETKYKNKKDIVLLFAGETTVTVTGKGKGGRNQEFCLGAIEDISKIKDAVLASIGTDGIDGPNNNAAGAIIDNKSLKKAEKLKLNPEYFLKNNDSHNFFKKTDELIFTGLTGSNVADVGIVIRMDKKI